MLNNKKPDIRFIDYNDDWEQRKLADVTRKIGSGKTPKGGSSVYSRSGVPLLRSQNIHNNRVNFEDIVYITESIDEEMANSRVEKNDVLLNITGASIGRTAVYNQISTSNVNQHVCIIRPTEEVNSYYIQQNLTSTKGQKQIELNQAGGGREGLNFQQIAKMNFYFPSLEEQNRISTFLQWIDNTITLHQSELTKLKQFKQSMLQKMFPREGQTEPEIRFEGFGGEWEEVTLGTITSYQSSDFTVNDVIKDGNFPIYDARTLIGHIDSYAINRHYISIVKDGAGAGRVRLLPPKSSVIATMGYILPINNACDVMYLYNSLLNFDFSKFIVGSTIPHIYYKDYSDEIIHLPSLQEQKAVGTFFENLEKKITVQEQKLTKIKQFKQGMLQKMFV